MQQRTIRQEPSVRSRHDNKKRRKDDSNRKRKDKQNQQQIGELQIKLGRVKLCQTAQLGAQLKSFRQKDPFNRTCNKQDLSGLIKQKKSKSKSKQDKRSRKQVKLDHQQRLKGSLRKQIDMEQSILNRTGKLDFKMKQQIQYEKNKTTQIDIKNILRQDDTPISHQQYINKQRIRIDLSKRVVFLLQQIGKDRLLSSFFLCYQSQQPYQPSKDKTLIFKQNFLVGKQIGQGAYASVRMALHRPTNSKVAIKIYQKNKIKDPQRKRSVLRQIKVMQMIDHPNIVRIIDAVQTNNHVNIVMQYIDGQSLNSYLKSKGKLQQIQAKSLFLQLLNALSHLHSLNIVHRDIKLQNILLQNQIGCCPILIDFGFSTCVPHHSKLKLFCGTPSYMAPQIVNKEQFSGPPTDIWALGVALWVILVGSFPFKGATDKQLFFKISRGVSSKSHLQHNLGSTLIPSVLSKHATSLLQAMLCTNPDRRPSAGQLILHPWFDQVKVNRRGIRIIQSQK